MNAHDKLMQIIHQHRQDFANQYEEAKKRAAQAKEMMDTADAILVQHMTEAVQTPTKTMSWAVRFEEHSFTNYNDPQETITKYAAILVRPDGSEMVLSDDLTPEDFPPLFSRVL